MSETDGKLLLLHDLSDQQDQVKKQLNRARSDVLMWQAAVDLWTELGEVEEQGTAALVLAACTEQVSTLSATYDRLQRALVHLNAT